MPFDSSSWRLPKAEGLYDPTYERDACGVGFIVHIDGSTSHKVLQDAEELSRRMVHRGACSADNDSGDGAGVLIGMPHSFYAKKLRSEQGVCLPSKGQYASGILFLEESTAEACCAQFSDLAASLGLSVLCWREVPTDSACLGAVARASEPKLIQVFVSPVASGETEEEVGRREIGRASCRERV